MHRCHDLVGHDRIGDSLCIANVADNKRTPFHEITVSCRQIVEADGKVSCFRESLAAMGANITGSTGYQNRRFLGHLSPIAMKTALNYRASATYASGFPTRPTL
jgi:hypothetical protein